MPAKHNPKLAAAVKRLRGALTQEQAAVRSGVSVKTWSSIERGQEPKKFTLVKIAREFDVDVEDLWQLTDDTPLVERFSDEELDRLAMRLAPLVADEVARRLRP